MRETTSVTIDGVTFTITQLGAKEGKKVLARISRAVAPVAAMAKDGVETGDILLKVTESLSDDNLDFFCDTFAKQTRFSEDGGAHEFLLSDKFDDFFAGRYGLMLQWLYASFEANFSRFLADCGLSLENLKEAAVAAAKQETAAPKKSEDDTPTRPDIQRKKLTAPTSKSGSPSSAA